MSDENRTLRTTGPVTEKPLHPHEPHIEDTAGTTRDQEAGRVDRDARQYQQFNPARATQAHPVGAAGGSQLHYPRLQLAALQKPTHMRRWPGWCSRSRLPGSKSFVMPALTMIARRRGCRHRGAGANAVPSVWCAYWPRQRPLIATAARRNALWPRITLSLPVIPMLTSKAGYSGKPASIDEARRAWRSMAGRAVALYGPQCYRLQDNKTVYRAAETVTTV